jgi:hypothetical protein
VEASSTSLAALAAAVGVVGLLIPASVISIALVKVFSVQPFEWRSKVNACLAGELDQHLRRRVNDDRSVILAVRWYKRPRELSLSNLTAEAFVSYSTISRLDGSVTHLTERLKVLDSEGNEADERTWPRMQTGMPFTLWIPTESVLRSGVPVEIQRRKVDGRMHGVLVRLTGKTVGLGTDVVSERWYSLAEDVQVGRFVPVDPDSTAPEKQWAGWRRFDGTARYGLFAYGSLVHRDAIRDLCGLAASEGRDGSRLLSGQAQELETIVDRLYRQ